MVTCCQITWNTFKYTIINPNTLILVCKHHPRLPQKVALIHRLSLYAGTTAWKVYTCGPVKSSLYYKQMVFIYRWALEQILLYTYIGNQCELFHVKLWWWWYHSLTAHQHRKGHTVPKQVIMIATSIQVGTV